MSRSLNFFFLFVLDPDGVGCLMGEVKAPLGLGTCPEKSPSKIQLAWPHRLASSA